MFHYAFHCAFHTVRFIVRFTLCVSLCVSLRFIAPPMNAYTVPEQGFICIRFHSMYDRRNVHIIYFGFDYYVEIYGRCDLLKTATDARLL